MDSRELVQLAKALLEYESVHVEKVHISVEFEGGRHGRDYVLHSNDDLFRPFHIGDLSFASAEEALEYVTQ